MTSADVPRTTLDVPADVPFRRVFTYSGVAFAVVSAEGDIVDTNDAFAAMTGVERGAVNGTPLLSFVAEPDRDRITTAFNELLHGAISDAQTELQFHRADGTLGTAAASGTAITDDHGSHYVVVLLQDVTPHRVAEQASALLRQRLDLLSRASDLVNVTLAVRPRMEAFARMVVPAFGDVCAVYLRGADGNLWLRRYFTNDDTIDAALRPLCDIPIEANAASPPAEAMRMTSIIRINDLDRTLTRRVDDGRRQEAAVSAGIRAVLCAPLHDKHGTFGAVLFGYHPSSGRAFGAEDELFARDLVSRVSGALANAIQFEDEHFIAERLQRALLPESLPNISGTDIAVRYRPSSGRRIGGDWYDVIRLPDGRVAFAIGDVVGHGIDAAVAMSTIRHSLRAYAIDESDPVRLLTRLNRYLCRQPGRTTATLALVVCDLHEGGLTITTAGHLPVVVRDPDGNVAFHGARLGRPIGLSPNATFHSESAHLAVGGVMVLYTDGLVERRTESLNAGLARLKAGVGNYDPTDDLERFADALEATVTEALQPDDDLALLLVRRDLASDHFETVIEAKADRLGGIRTDLRRWLRHVGCGEPAASELVLAIGECAANVVEHAYPPGTSGPLEIRGDVARDGDPSVADITVEIRDRGRWRAPRDVGGGRGHALLQQLVDEAQVDSGDGGTAVALRRRVTLAPAVGP